jgi:hypothetical protein
MISNSVFSARHSAGRGNQRIEKRVHASICKEGSKLCGGVDRVVVGKLCQRKELKTIGLTIYVCRCLV